MHILSPIKIHFQSIIYFSSQLPVDVTLFLCHWLNSINTFKETESAMKLDERDKEIFYIFDEAYITMYVIMMSTGLGHVFA